MDVSCSGAAFAVSLQLSAYCSSGSVRLAMSVSVARMLAFNATISGSGPIIPVVPYSSSNRAIHATLGSIGVTGGSSDAGRMVSIALEALRRSFREEERPGGSKEDVWLWKMEVAIGSSSKAE